MKQFNRYLAIVGAMIVGACMGMIMLFVWAGRHIYEDMIGPESYTQDDLDEVVFPPDDWK